ncbi:MAG: YceI family protein [Ktedonobacterales bacterium]|nr:YceI family protein [Ktedonobacterales bacterium]
MGQPLSRLHQLLGPSWSRAHREISQRMRQAQQQLTPALLRAQAATAARVARLRTMWQQPRGRILLSLSAGALLTFIIAGAVAGNYVFGGENDQAYHGPITAPTLVPTSGGTLFAISQSASTASFTIHEVLFGKPKTVVGKTQQVAGQILIDAHQPSRSKLSTIRVDLGTLATDDDRRTHTLHTRILQPSTAANEYATFVPTSYSGLPTSFSIGKPVTFHLHGNLTIHQVTKPEVFTVTLKQVSATQLVGSATTTVNYADFKLAIPNIPFVSDVGKSVVLALDFTAAKPKA